MAVPSPSGVIINARDTNPTLVSSGVSAAAVTANTVLQTVGVSTPGLYQVTAWSLPGGGTVASTDAGNVVLKKNGAQLAVVPQAAATGVAPTPLTLNLVLAAGDTLTLVVGANAAPASVYYASALIVQQQA